ncbi:shieldin complex subunit 1 isoform X2 [Athene noctua]|uniref:shieldin complex subunit 1 isoform X2 n=1 Tax=Athene noctua TaxID=126797 RepID=UPI003EBD7547
MLLLLQNKDVDKQSNLLLKEKYTNVEREAVTVSLTKNISYSFLKPCRYSTPQKKKDPQTGSDLAMLLPGHNTGHKHHFTQEERDALKAACSPAAFPSSTASGSSPIACADALLGAEVPRLQLPPGKGGKERDWEQENALCFAPQNQLSGATASWD